MGYLRSSLARAPVAALVGALAVTTGAGAACYGPNRGADRQNFASYSDGAKAHVEFVSADVGTGKSLFHPMQLLFANDFIAVGTHRGSGTSGHAEDCPEDTTGWNVYVDGIINDVYFCRSLSSWPEFDAADDGQLFKIIRQSCGGAMQFQVFVNSTSLGCYDPDGNNADFLSAGGEFLEPVPGTNVKHIDIRYYDLMRHRNYDDTWVAWGSTYAASCADLGYRVRVLASDDIWAEKEP